jgi:hypothetical protein
MGKGKRKNQKGNNAPAPGTGGANAGVGGSGGPETVNPQVLPWVFDLATENAKPDWEGREIWGKVERSAVYIELTGIGSLGRVPDPPSSQILAAVKASPGKLRGEILKVSGSSRISVELQLLVGS